MSYKREFYNEDQAMSYLTNSVIRLDKEPIYITGVRASRNDYRLAYSTVGNQREPREIKYSDKKLDLSPIPLGFINYPKRTGRYPTPNLSIWAGRSPRRGWKIGLSTGAIVLQPQGTDTNILRDLDKSHLITSSPFRQTVVGNYPSFKKIVEKLKGDESTDSLAFSRRFCLDRKNNVFYKHLPNSVGIWMKKKLS